MSDTPLDKDALLAKALVNAQAELSNPSFDAVNPFLKNKYATLRAHLDAVRPVLNKHGLAVSQGIVGQGNAVGVVTRLIHKDGGVLTDCIMSTIEKPTGQAIGALTTYLRRYGLAAICGVVGEEDDDGNADAARREKQAASSQKVTPTVTERKQDAPTKPATPKAGDTREVTATLQAVGEIESKHTADGKAWEIITDKGVFKLGSKDAAKHGDAKLIHGAASIILARQKADRDKGKTPPTVIVSQTFGKQDWLTTGIREQDDIPFN